MAVASVGVALGVARDVGGVAYRPQTGDRGAAAGGLLADGAVPVPPAGSADASPGATPAASPTAAAGPSPSTARSSARPAPPPANLASRLHTLPSGTQQVIIVHATGYGTSYATLVAFHRRNGGWTPALAPMAARIGAAGFADDKREGDQATPTGVYAIDATMYGTAANPGVRYGYHVLVPGDYWNENSDSPGYNTFVHGSDPGGPSEALWEITPQYTHFAVIRYNMPATPGRGSGIFLHQSGAGATLGCVSLAHANLVAVLRWLDPAAAPRVVMAPVSALGRY